MLLPLYKIEEARGYLTSTQSSRHKGRGDIRALYALWRSRPAPRETGCMQYTCLGNTGLIVSRLAFGAMTFGASDGPMASIMKVDEDEAKQLVDRCLDAGITFFDTADAYAGGQSEELLGKALGKRRKDVVLATKVGFRTGPALHETGLSRRHIISGCEASLRRLGTDYIDVYLAHRVDPYTPLEETLGAFNNLVRRGLVRYIGFSNWNAWQAAVAVGVQRANSWARFVAAQMYYSLLGRDMEHELVPFFEHSNIGAMVWSPLAGGFLTGKYTRQDPTGGGGRITGFDFLPMDKESAYDLVDQMREMGDRYKATVAQIALAWLLSKPYVSTIILGASNTQQLEDNLGATNFTLSAEDLTLLDQLTRPKQIYPNWFNRKTGDVPVAEALGNPVS